MFEDAWIGLDEVQVAREPEVLKKLGRDVAGFDEIALTVAPMDDIGVREGGHVIAIALQLGDAVESFVSNAIGHARKRIDNLAVVGQRRIRIGRADAVANFVAEGIERKLTLFDFAQWPLLVCHVEQFADLWIADGAELLDAAVGAKVKNDGTEVENYVFNHCV